MNDRHVLDPIRAKVGKWMLFVALAAALGAGDVAQAGTAGNFAKALKDRFCTGISGPTWYGCFGYMHYRVDLVKDKNSAKSTCYRNGCGSKYGSGGDYDRCKQGCDRAYGQDYQ